MRTVGATLAISALLGGAVACGGKDGGGGSDGEREATRAIQPEAQEYAQSLILTLSDFPDGWRQRQADDETTGREEFRACLGVDLSPFTITGEAESDDFLIGEYAEVSSAADVFKSEQMASDAFAEAAAGYDSEEADACMTELVGGGGDDVEFGEIEIGPLSFTPPSGVDESRAWQVVVPIEGASGTASDGVSVTGYIDVVALREGDTVVLVRSFDFDNPFDPELRDQLVETIADRMTG